MSAPWSLALRENLLDQDDVSNTVLIPANQTQNVFATDLRLRPYSRAALVSYGQAWDAAGNNLLKFHLLVNGSKQFPYEDRVAAVSSPFGDSLYLPRIIPLPQLARINVSVEMGAVAQSVNFNARLIVYYFDQDPELLTRLVTRPGFKALAGSEIRRRA